MSEGGHTSVTTSPDSVPVGPANFLGGQRYLIDNSVFGRVTHPDMAPIWKEGLEGDLFVACSPFVLEALQSAEGAQGVSDLKVQLTEGLRYIEPDTEIWKLAFRAQETMAAVEPGWHRASPVDYLIAAIAHREEIAVLHYDHDYEKIEADSGLVFEAKWVADAGSLEGPGEQPQIVRQLKRAISNRLRDFHGEADEERIHRVLVGALDAELDKARKPARQPPPP